jgi:hypothetical protein
MCVSASFDAKVCCDPVVTLFLHCCCTIVTLLLHCCDTKCCFPHGVCECFYRCEGKTLAIAPSPSSPSSL